MDEPRRCLWCNHVIGVYEPMVVCTEGERYETSLLRELPHGPIGDIYHRGCYRQASSREAESDP